MEFQSLSLEIEDLSNSSEKFSVNFDELVKLICLSTRIRDAYRTLTRTYVSGTDYIQEDKSAKSRSSHGGQNKKRYRVTIDCAKRYARRSQPRPTEGPGYIYVLRHENMDLFKIGRSTNVKHRMTELQIGNPFELVLMGTFKFARYVATERRLHKKLEDFNFRGEWFRCSYDKIVFEINEEMKLAAANAIAGTIRIGDLSEEYIIPSVFNRDVVQQVAKAVALAAIDSGVARRKRPMKNHPLAANEYATN